MKISNYNKYWNDVRTKVKCKHVVKSRVGGTIHLDEGNQVIFHKGSGTQAP